MVLLGHLVSYRTKRRNKPSLIYTQNVIQCLLERIYLIYCEINVISIGKPLIHIELICDELERDINLWCFGFDFDINFAFHILNFKTAELNYIYRYQQLYSQSATRLYNVHSMSNIRAGKRSCDPKDL